MIRGGLIIEGDAKRMCPVDTGRLRASISTNWDDSGFYRAPVEPPAHEADGVSQPTRGEGDIAIVRIGTNIEYGIYQELGTRRMQPHPFLYPAVMMNLNKIKKMIEDTFKGEEK